jgi:serpin B
MKAILCIMLLGCVVLAVAGAAGPAAEDNAAAKKLASAQNAFATDLYAQLRQDKGNLFFSPYSISSALGMTYVGAKGDTAGEMAKVLHLADLQPAEVDRSRPLSTLATEAYAEQHKLFNQPRKEGLELHVANALWGKPNYAFNQDFVKSVKANFDGDLQGADFANEPAARKTINDWVAGATKDKIKDLIGPGVLTPATRLVLTNAIYFKAAWATQFAKEATRKAKFHLAADKDAEVDMMNDTDHYSLAELDGFKMLTIPYKDNQASMLILLPEKVDGLGDLEKTLTAEKLAAWIDKSKSAYMELSMPKFKCTCKFELSGQLTAMGMKLAFQAGKADFTGIANVPDEPLFIGAVIHKAFVDVSEEGTEAAAATAVVMLAGSAMQTPPKPVLFTADHPFIYVIRDNRTGDILFLGRLADPTAKGE